MSGPQALAALIGGVLLIAVECSRPGRVVPGAAGLFFSLWGGWWLLRLAGWSSVALWLGAAGLLALASLRWRWRRGIPAVVGVLLLTASLCAAARDSGGQLDERGAALAGMLLGACLAGLLGAAGVARRAKAGHRGAPAGTRPTGVPERWGVD